MNTFSYYDDCFAAAAVHDIIITECLLLQPIVNRLQHAWRSHKSDREN